MLLDANKIDLMRSGTFEGLVLYYNAIFSDRGWTLPPHLIPVAKALTDPRIDKLMVIIGPGSGKSQFMSIVYPSYALGLDPTQTALGISAGESLITGFIRSAMELIEHSPVYKIVFPSVRPDKEAGWSTERGMFVTGRKPGVPDASYWGAGISSKALPGKHARTIIMDDVHDDENSRTETGREGVLRIYQNTIIGRGDPRGARYIISGRRWHERDLYGVLEAEGDYVTMVLPNERENEKLLFWDITVPDGLICCFNEIQNDA